ncbi:MAG: NAD(P)-dependent alcohol dehydrogenase [Pseudomonadota bacterium]
MKITAAVKYKDKDTFDLEEIAIDAPRDDEILVRIAGVGLCHTDIVFAAGSLPDYPFPAVFGHEGSGIVEQVGANVTKVAPGDRVSITFRSCGTCDRCDSGDAPYCRTMPFLNYIGSRMDGSSALQGENGSIGSNFFGQSSFASHALTYERNVVKVEEGLPLDIMGPLGCGIQTGAGGVMRSLAAEAGSSILITGGGPVGLAAVMGAKIQQCSTVILSEPQAARRDLALELGATHVLDPTAMPDLAAAVREIVPQGLDYAFDTAGIPEVLSSMMTCLGSKGTLGIVGITPPGTPLPGDIATLMTFGQSIRGIIEGDSDPDTFIPELIEHFKAGRLPFDKLIKTYPLSQINEAIADQHAGKCVKVVLIPD